MRILMLGNSFTFTNHMPQMLADLTGSKVVHHTRGGARLSEQLNPNTRLGSQTQAALQKEKWDYVVLQEMSHGPITAPKSFFSSVEQLCRQIRANGVHTPLEKCSLTADDGASLPLKWCTNSAEMVHGGRRRGARGRHAGNHSGMPLRLRMDSPSIWMV